MAEAQPSSEEKYSEYLERSQTLDLSDIEALNLIIRGGQDMKGRPVVCFLACNLPAKGGSSPELMDRLLLYLVKLLDDVVTREYVVVYFHDSSARAPDFGYLKNAYSVLGRKFKKNLKNLFIMRPGFWLKAFFKFITPFVSQKFWQKVQHFQTLAELHQHVPPFALNLPEGVLGDAFDDDELVLEPKEAPLRSGHLSKQTFGKVKLWRRRFCSLHPNALYYYTKQGDVHVRGYVEIDSECTLDFDDGDDKFAFTIVHLDRSPAHFRCSDQEDFQEWTKVLMRCISRPKVFGRDLDELLKAEEDRAMQQFVESGSTGSPPAVSDLPLFVEKALSYLECHPSALQMEGIFRLSGNRREMDEIKDQFDSVGNMDISEVGDPNAITGLLKKWFRELPEPLFTYELYNQWAAVDQLPESERIPKCTALLPLLPPSNAALTFRLFRFFAKVVSFSGVNKMTSSNLSIVMAPNLMRCEADNSGDSMAMISESPVAIRVVQYMIDKHESIFVGSRPSPLLAEGGLVQPEAYNAILNRTAPRRRKKSVTRGSQRGIQNSSAMIERLEETVSSPTASVEDWEKLANACSRSGDNQRALEAFDNAMRLDPNNPAVFLGRGQIFENMNQLPLALEEYQRCLAVAPAFTPAKFAIANVEQQLKK